MGRLTAEALTEFFRTGNLIASRELALRVPSPPR